MPDLSRAERYIPRREPSKVPACDIVYQQLSAAAYLDDDALCQECSRLGYTLIEHIHDDGTGADAIVVQNAEEVVVAFRGTQRDYRDIFTNLQFQKTSFLREVENDIEVHAGFHEQWLSIFLRIFAAVRAASEEDADDPRPVVVTGHSLGGALAVMATKQWTEPAACVTFGAPRVGDRRFKEVFNRGKYGPHRRYVLGADIVPIVPLMAMGYRHDGRPIYLTHTGKVIARCRLWRELAGRVAALFSLDWPKSWSWCPVPLRVFTDHRIDAYGDAMRKANRDG